MIETDHIAQWLKRPIEVEEETRERLARQFELRVCEALLRESPDHIPALAAIGHIYTRAGLHEKALAVDRHLLELIPTDPIAHYNLACSLSNLEEVEEALDELQRSLDLGWTDLQLMVKDPDLENVRQHPRFRSLLERARRKGRQ